MMSPFFSSDVWAILTHLGYFVVGAVIGRRGRIPVRDGLSIFGLCLPWTAFSLALQMVWYRQYDDPESFIVGMGTAMIGGGLAWARARWGGKPHPILLALAALVAIPCGIAGARIGYRRGTEFRLRKFSVSPVGPPLAERQRHLHLG